jgi:hypothetical protein
MAPGRKSSTDEQSHFSIMDDLDQGWTKALQDERNRNMLEQGCYQIKFVPGRTTNASENASRDGQGC